MAGLQWPMLVCPLLISMTLFMMLFLKHRKIDSCIFIFIDHLAGFDDENFGLEKGHRIGFAGI